MDLSTNRQQLEQAIAVQESLRGTIDDAIIDATIATLKEKLAALEPVPQQRKQVTVLFMDVVGSTEIVHQLDPEDNLAIMDTALKKLSIPVEEHGGHVSRYMGDGFNAIFGMPVARENDPEMAVRAGLGIQAAAEEYAGEVADKWGIPDFRVRVGINTGLAVIGGHSEAEDTVAGTVVNLAARLESAAEPGTVLISHDSYKHVWGIFDFEPLKPIQAKGFPDPVAVYRVLRAKERLFYRGMHGVEGVETHMVGREVEFLQLQNTLKKVIEEGDRAMITVVGEAGLGKSRLLYEFENWVDLQSEIVLLYKGRARLETQGISYGLLRDLFAFRFQITDDDQAQAVREKLVAGFQATLGIDEQAEMKSHLIGQLLGYDFSKSPHLEGVRDDPQQLRDRAFLYLVEYFQGISSHEPVLILLEDLHWADDSSLDALNHLATELSKKPVLIVGTTRHTLLERRPNWMEGQKFHQRLDLGPLSRGDSLRLVAEVLQKVQNIPAALQDLLVENAEGNPFYVEELIKMLVEDGVIVPEEPHWRVETERLVEVNVPPTLTGVLQARLDSLPRQEREVLQQASVVGRVFWDRVLEHINVSVNQPMPERGIAAILDHLRDRELVFRRETSVFADTREHIFKHALLREVIYESVLKGKRRDYHALIADWLVVHAGERASEFTGLIADHYEGAGKATEALAYLRRAGEEAAGKYANEEAIGYLSRALALVPEEDLEFRFDLLLIREKVYDQQGKRETHATDLAALEKLAKSLGQAKKEAEVALRRSRYAEATSDFPGAIEAAQMTISLAEESGDQEPKARGYLAWGRALWRGGDYRNAQEPLNQALALARLAQTTKLVADCMRNLGIVASHQGDNTGAQRYYEQALEIYRKIGDLRGEAHSLHNLGIVANFQGDFAMAKAYFEQVLPIRHQTGYRRAEGYALNNLGWVARAQGEFTHGEVYFEQALRISRQVGDQSNEARVLNNFGSVAYSQGDYARAEGYWEETLMISRQVGYLEGEGLALYGFGQVAYIQGDYTKAQAYFEQALRIFRQINYRQLEAYVLTGLGNVMLESEHLEEAQDAFHEAVTLREELGQIHLAVESRAGLIRVALTNGDLINAKSQVSVILNYLEVNGSLDGTEEPFRIYLTCHKVLHATQDSQASEILETAHGLLQERSTNISNKASRRSFLENVPWHQEIMALWEVSQGVYPP